MFNARVSLETLVVNAKKIVIIGDGPIALAQAIALKNKGLDVRIVGPRLGYYTRSGDLRETVVTEEINRLIAPHEIKDTPSLHIKDTERQLYDIVLQMGIPTLKQKFVGYVNHKTIEIKDEHNKITQLETDLIYDCTGTTRACLNKINDIYKNTFSFNIVPDNPHKSYAVVRAILRTKQHEIFNRNFNPYFKIDPVLYVLGMEELREMGWQSFSMPICYANAFPKKILDSVDTNNVPKYTEDKDFQKVNIFLQIPDGMEDPREIEKFAKIIMKILRNNPQNLSLPNFKIHHESTKIGKPMISAYEVEPRVTTPGFYRGDEKIPPILHAGDATANVPTYMAVGVIMGAERCTKLNKTLVIQEGVLQAIKTKEYNRTSTALLDKQVAEIAQAFNGYKEIMETGNELAGEHYRTIFKAYLEPLEARFDIPQELLNNPLYIKKIIEGLKILDPKFLFGRIQKLVEMGDSYYRSKTDAKAIMMYKLVLNVFEMNPSSYVADIIALYSSLILVQKDNISEVIKLADEVYKKYVPLLVEKNDKLENILKRINYHKTMALLKHAGVLMKQDTESLVPEIKRVIESIEKTISTFQHPEVLIAQYDLLKKKYPHYFTDELDHQKSLKRKR